MSSAGQLVTLLGSDYEDLGKIATVTLGINVAISLSRGKHPKGYSHLDPNEDAVGAATSHARTLLAVVDGHSGFDAARAAINAVLADKSSELETNRQVLAQAFTKAKAAIDLALANLPTARRNSQTSLITALIDGESLTTASLGDSSAVILSGDAGTPLGAPSNFLDAETDLDQVVFDEASLQSRDRVVLCTDGLSDFLGRRWVHRLGELVESHPKPAEFAEAAIRTAFAGGAGDNIAVAVYAHD